MSDQKTPARTGDDLDDKARDFLQSGDNRDRMLGKLRDEVTFTEDAIVRYTKMRLQIDTDP